MDQLKQLLTSPEYQDFIKSGEKMVEVFKKIYGDTFDRDELQDIAMDYPVLVFILSNL